MTPCPGQAPPQSPAARRAAPAVPPYDWVDLTKPRCLRMYFDLNGQELWDYRQHAAGAGGLRRVLVRHPRGVTQLQRADYGSASRLAIADGRRLRRTLPGLPRAANQPWAARPGWKQRAPGDNRRARRVRRRRGLAEDGIFWASCGFAHLHIDSRGQGSTWSPGDTPDNGPVGQLPGMMTVGIDHPSSYYYRRLITDVSALWTLLRRCPSLMATASFVLATARVVASPSPSARWRHRCARSWRMYRSSVTSLAL